MAMKQHAYQIPSFFLLWGRGDDGIFVVPNIEDFGCAFGILGKLSMSRI
jgi:hypothetical protein